MGVAITAAENATAGATLRVVPGLGSDIDVNVSLNQWDIQLDWGEPVRPALRSSPGKGVKASAEPFGQLPGTKNL